MQGAKTYLTLYFNVPFSMVQSKMHEYCGLVHLFIKRKKNTFEHSKACEPW